MDKRCKWNYEKVKEFIESENYTLVSTEYKNVTTKLKMICSEGHECEISWANFHNNNRRCRKCGRKKASEKQKLTIEFVKEAFKEKGYTLLEDIYVDAHTPMKYICSNGHEHKINWTNFNTGQGCSKCRDEKLREERQFSYEYISEYVRKYGYEIISEEYVNARTPLELKCPQGHLCYITFWDFKKGSRCNVCENKYKGERRIAKYLDDNNINYITQKTFKDCKDISYLKYDFYIPSLNICIEYDGEQHYQVGFGKGEEGLADRKRKDKIKTNYCVNNNINLLRIPYWDFENIEEIINQKIKTLKTFDGQVS